MLPLLEIWQDIKCAINNNSTIKSATNKFNSHQK